ncbi:MAG: aminotransferase class V-fold PLP-dependent enzyme [Pseudomonadota bacterium]
MLSTLADDVSVLESGTLQEAISLLERSKRCDLIIIDLAMPGMESPASLAKVKAIAPGTPVVVITASEDQHDVRAALEAGASGYIPKSVRGQIMLSALQLVLVGGGLCPAAGARRLDPGLAQPDRRRDLGAHPLAPDRASDRRAAAARRGQAEQGDRADLESRRRHGTGSRQCGPQSAERAQPHRSGPGGAQRGTVGVLTPRFGHPLRGAFCLDEAVAFLNHGSFGATPRVVLAAQERWRSLMERQPVHFMGRELPPALDRARAALAAFLGADPAGLALVENATAGVNSVLRALTFSSGDEILVTALGYPAVLNAARFVAARSGARLVTVELPLPIRGADEIRAAIGGALSPRTRLAILDHVTSATACVLPIAALVEDCHRAGVPVLVDGAHAPGMLALDLARLDADWYTGNCHKWLFAAKGTAFLYARPDRRADLHPLVISHGLDKGLQAEFDWPGTRDFTAWLALPEAIAFHRSHDSDAVCAHNHELAITMADELARAWGTELAVDPTLLGAMATVRLPFGAGATAADAAATHDRLIDQFNVEVPVTALANALWLRISAQIYNEPEDYRRLAAAVRAIQGN